MKKILITSTLNKINEQIRDAVESAAKKNGTEVLNLNNIIAHGLISPGFSISQSISHLIESSDLVVAYITDYNPNLFYEIGLAHGLGKNVLIISDDSFKVPADLINQKVVTLSNNPDDKGQNIFRLEKLFHQILYENETPNSHKSTNKIKDLEISNSELNYEFEDVLHLKGIASHKMFEKWFLDLIKGIPEWEVIQAPPVDEGYDFVIWNGSNDSELNILGNPIPVELKAGIIGKDIVQRLVSNALTQGVKGIILLTTANKTRSIDIYIKEIYEEKRFVVIFLDLNDLLKVKNSKEFKKLMMSKLFSLVFGVADRV